MIIKQLYFQKSEVKVSSLFCMNILITVMPRPIDSCISLMIILQFIFQNYLFTKSKEFLHLQANKPI